MFGTVYIVLPKWYVSIATFLVHYTTTLGHCSIVKLVILPRRSNAMRFFFLAKKAVYVNASPVSGSPTNNYLLSCVLSDICILETYNSTTDVKSPKCQIWLAKPSSRAG